MSSLGYDVHMRGGSYIPVGPVSSELEPHPLLPDGYRFSDDDVLVITEWGDALPPANFSHDRLLELADAVERPRLHDEEKVLLLAHYLLPKITFTPDLGCWELPLAEEYDEKNRARYPSVTIKDLGYNKQLAHRASVEIFKGVPLPVGEGRQNQIDHRCRTHACCNPYHLEVVCSAINNLRRIIAQKRAVAGELFQLPTDRPVTFGELALIDTVQV